MIKTNSPKAWFLAARPKTLTGALAPVCVGLSAAWVALGSLQWMPAALCVVFALLMQIDANLVNDFLDFRGGIDREDRLGPERACAQGWITPEAMQRGIAAVTTVACLTGLPLVWWGGWGMVIIGATCVIACVLYSTLARLALGDVLVVVFFGLVPVCATYYLQAGTVDHDVFLAAMAMGLVTDCLLLVNNFRDRDTDRRVGKHTIPNLIGERRTYILYALVGAAACALVYSQTRLPVFYLAVNFYLVSRMQRIRRGRALNKILGQTAASILLFALLYSVGIIMGW